MTGTSQSCLLNRIFTLICPTTFLEVKFGSLKQPLLPRVLGNMSDRYPSCTLIDVTARRLTQFS